MCNYEEFLFECGHTKVQLKSYCHFARNDPYHGCYGVKVLKDTWHQGKKCDPCIVKEQQEQQKKKEKGKQKQ